MGRLAPGQRARRAKGRDPRFGLLNRQQRQLMGNLLFDAAAPPPQLLAWNRYNTQPDSSRRYSSLFTPICNDETLVIILRRSWRRA